MTLKDLFLHVCRVYVWGYGCCVGGCCVCGVLYVVWGCRCVWYVVYVWFGMWCGVCVRSVCVVYVVS